MLGIKSRTIKRISWILITLGFSIGFFALMNGYPEVMLHILAGLITIGLIWGLWWISGEYIFPDA